MPEINADVFSRLRHLEADVRLLLSRQRQVDPVVMANSAELLFIKLKEALAAGESADAYVRLENEDRELQLIDGTNDAVKVYAAPGQTGSIPEDTEGVAVRGASKLWWLSTPAEGGGGLRVCTCRLTADITGATTTTSVDDVAPIDGGTSPVSSSTETLTVYNPMACAGPDNQPAIIIENQSYSPAHWELLVVKNVSQSVQTGFLVDGTNRVLQVKTRTLWGNFAGAESGWTTVHTGTNCP